jgi:hypothetical protein
MIDDTPVKLLSRFELAVDALTVLQHETLAESPEGPGAVLSILHALKRNERFKQRVLDEVQFYRSAHGDAALERLRGDLAKPNLRTQYRRVLEAAAEKLDSEINSDPAAKAAATGRSWAKSKA